MSAKRPPSETPTHHCVPYRFPTIRCTVLVQCLEESCKSSCANTSYAANSYSARLDTCAMNPNPHDLSTAGDADEVVDRTQRDGLADTIRQFLSDQSTAFEFDEELDDYRKSADPTVQFVTNAVWYHYDDCDDHIVTLSRPEWDYFQRLLLILQSDRQIVITAVRRWSWTQLVACISLLSFAGCIWHFGWGQHLLVFSVPFGVVSIVISFVRNKTRVTGPYDQILSPFPTFTDLSSTYRSTVTFRKKRYPRSLTNRRIRSRVAEFGVQLQMYAAWLMLSPIPLLVQTLPMTDTQTSVKSA